MGINSIVPTGLYPCIPSIPALKCRAKFIPSLMGRIAVQKMYKLQTPAYGRGYSLSALKDSLNRGVK